MQRITHHRQSDYRTSNEERRRYERWVPGEFAIASIYSTADYWCGRVLNLSDGGAEVLGLPPQENNGQVVVEISLEYFTLVRVGRILRVRKERIRDSHAICFEDVGETSDHTCVVCGMPVDERPGDPITGVVYICPECDESTHNFE
jgi:hypothetical protein